MMILLPKPVRVKGATFFPKGTPVDIEPLASSPMICEIRAKGMTHRVHYLRLFSGPTRGLICAWITRDCCKSVMGEHVKPGGFDLNGFPCWSKVYGMQ